MTQKWVPYAKKTYNAGIWSHTKVNPFTPYQWIKVFGWFLVKSASVLSAISWADLLEVTCKQQATGSSRAWPTPKDDLSRSVLYLHCVSFFRFLSMCIWIYCKVPLRHEKRSKTVHCSFYSKIKTTYPPNLFNFTTINHHRHC